MPPNVARAVKGISACTAIVFPGMVTSWGPPYKQLFNNKNKKENGNKQKKMMIRCVNSPSQQ